MPMQSENQLIETFTGKSSLEQCSTDQWTDLTSQYPAFALGHYFRAKQLLKSPGANKEQLTRAKQAAALHFNDALWLDFLLHTGPRHAEAPTATEDQLQAAASPVAPDSEQTAPESPATASSREKQPDSEAEQEAARLSEVLSKQLADFKKPVAQDAKLEVQREPLYKVDYFASQGIAASKQLDVLGKKVRKFTDWLKEMKQLTPDRSGVPQLNTSAQEEAQAALKAEASLKNEPIWTQSMAEVLISQGKVDQAKEVYQKLSLLYPEKSAYFASKIDLLQ